MAGETRSRIVYREMDVIRDWKCYCFDTKVDVPSCLDIRSFGM